MGDGGDVDEGLFLVGVMEGRWRGAGRYEMLPCTL